MIKDSEKTLEGLHECRCQNRYPEHVQRSHDVFSCVSRRPGARLERLCSACVCLFSGFDGWCHVSRTDFLADDDCADICQSDRGASAHSAQPAMAVWESWSGLVVIDAVFLIKLMSKKEAWCPGSYSMNYMVMVPNLYVMGTLSSAFLRAYTSLGQSCVSGGPF